ncbi:class I SAM-dependent methyltransferase [Bordetella genomosp. 12]|nr:class I SAM-dependent methyltransferase [Bordetella genomosp. 12]
MQAWNAGYITEVPYTYGYYRELNPLWLTFVMGLAGYRFPATGHACELGFGQGLSVNIHASASGWDWHGTDFNPAQAAFAQELARTAGHTACLRDDAFEAFARRADLPDFDFIALHGIWSWIPDHSRQAILDLIHRKLKVGGVVYVSYNALPGWAPMLPIRHLLALHARSTGGPLIARAQQALDFCDRLLAAEPLYQQLAPLIKERVPALREHPMEYLLHEYFNKQWEPQTFSNVADSLARAKLDFACSADPFDHVETLHTTTEQQAVLAGLADPVLREDARDIMVGRSFRKDCWIKGARQLSPEERQHDIAQQRVVLCTPRSAISMTVRGATREATMKESVHEPLLDLLEQHGPISIGELQSRLQAQDIAASQTLEALLVLAGSGHVHPVQDSTATTRRFCRNLNRHVLAQSGDLLQYLASPVTGGGIALDHVSRLMLEAVQAGGDLDAWVAHAWRRLDASGRRLMKDGNALPDEASNLAELRSLAEHFQAQRLPLMRTLDLI